MIETEQLTRRDIMRSRSTEGAFAVFKDTRFGRRLGFRFSDGRMKSLPYTHLIETEYNPDLGGIILTFAGYRVTISGRNLRELYLSIEEEVVAEIRERHDFHDVTPADPAEADAKRRACYIDAMLFEVI